MEPNQVKSFTERFLKAYDCRIIEQTPDYLQTQLSVKTDKDLVHRPFYWMYVEKMGIKPQPVTLTFAFEPDKAPPKIRSELLSFGSPRFSQILKSAQKNGRFVRLYENDSGRLRRRDESKPYTPWLGVNYKLSYICDQKKDEIIQLGIHLRTGDLLQGFFDRIRNREWSSKLPTHRHIIPALISVPEAVGEMEYFLQGIIEQQDLSWARSAEERMKQELARLDAYYPEEWRMSDELHSEKRQRIRETIRQYHPKVEVEVINAGLFYLDEDVSFHLTPKKHPIS
ncbi:YqhG family protein [Paludifilum halophilum]|nr:YqhG family protein [Paludifilum halophilum]